MLRAPVGLLVVFAVILDVEGQEAKYKKYSEISDATPFAFLSKNMKEYVNNMLAAKTKLDTIKGSGYISRIDRCRYSYEIDSNVLLYLLKRWSTKDIVLHGATRDVRVHMARNWYLILTTRVFYMFNCLFRPGKLVQDTLTVTKPDSP